VISDSGKGIDLPLDVTGGLGLEIVQTLVRDELGGHIEFAHESEHFPQGTRVTIRIPVVEGHAAT